MEYEFFSHGPDGIYNIHLKIDGKIAENGDSILELYAFFNNGYGTAHHYSWSGQAIYIKNLKLLANNGLETGIIYQALASSVIDSYIGVSMSSFTNDMDISNSSSTLIEVDLEKPGYPPELKVIFRQK
ncbi:MAG: hypothetical protein GWN00_32585 [Aliifodinibius sp.]|nr:hypothetical protein [Fodinibius sp.]NIV15508.1 hypothetical protein [Fodinibius sp.]NIY29355.1 hypothetical protein [Fodinibius sp.]